jgi:hypothetical protein
VVPALVAAEVEDGEEAAEPAKRESSSADIVLLIALGAVVTIRLNLVFLFLGVFGLLPVVGVNISPMAVDDGCSVGATTALPALLPVCKVLESNTLPLALYLTSTSFSSNFHVEICSK